jgi:flagellar basal-body rod modification protein FlgD
MAINNVSTLATANSMATQSKSKNASEMDQNDFLRLMTKQLEHQDPFNTVDNTEMIAQMAQFSSLAGVNQTNVVLDKISEQMTAQTQLLKEIKAATMASASATQEG